MERDVPGRALMIQGTMSSVGKSLLVAALCRIFREDGLTVAPFKAQNMALNSFVTLDGYEVGRAQAMQAEAAGVSVSVEMNPILIKPEADSFSQIIVRGRPWERLPAREYMKRRGELWSVVTESLDALRERYELVIIEGAGSPVEVNLNRTDIVNMAVAEYADAPVLLVGDIDRGGVFAQLLGTLWLFEEPARRRVRGLLVNKFRGDKTLFDSGRQILEERGQVPVLGVIPFIRDLRIADEDSLALDDRAGADTRREGAVIDIAVLRLPRISNFDEFDPFRHEPDVSLRFVDRAQDLGHPDLIIIPGSKTTVADLAFLRTSGLADAIRALAREGAAVIGVCGGYQMLGVSVRDPWGVESETHEASGLGLLPVVTTFDREKATVRARGRVLSDSGLFAGAGGLEVSGYEIHMGQTEPAGETTPVLRILDRGSAAASDASDGAVAAGGWIAGSYVHGLFENDDLRAVVLRNLAARKNRARGASTVRIDRGASYDRLAATVRQHVDVAALHRLLSQP